MVLKQVPPNDITIIITTYQIASTLCGTKSKAISKQSLLSVSLVGGGSPSTRPHKNCQDKQPIPDEYENMGHTMSASGTKSIRKHFPEKSLRGPSNAGG